MSPSAIILRPAFHRRFGATCGIWKPPPFAARYAPSPRRPSVATRGPSPSIRGSAPARQLAL